MYLKLSLATICLDKLILEFCVHGGSVLVITRGRRLAIWKLWSECVR